MRPLILVGGGGHCKACIDIIESLNQFSIAGIIDLPELIGAQVGGYLIIGSDGKIPELARKGYEFFISIGQVENVAPRRRIAELLHSNEIIPPTIISKSAFVSGRAEIGLGTIVMNNSVVGSHVKIGDNVIINTSAVIEHDSIVEECCHIATAAIINGSCKIGKNTLIGSNSTIIESITIAADTVIGAGSIVVENIQKSGVYVGNPAKRVES